MEYVLETYKSRYDVKDKILFIYEPVLVKDFVKVRELLDKDIEIRIVER